MNDSDLFIDAYLKFYETVLSNTGYDELLFQKTFDSLEKLVPSIQEKGYVENKIASVFIDMSSALESASHRHNSQIQQKISYAIDKLTDLARQATDD